MELTFSVANLPYLRYLKFVAYSYICTRSEPTPWPSYKSGKPVSQYWFSTRSLPMFTILHSEWYRIVDNKSIKIIPLNIGELLKVQGLAHLIMGDGYWKGKTVYICTDNFTLSEVELLANVITTNFGILARVNKRIKYSLRAKEKNANIANFNICWTIRISELSVPGLRKLVVPFMVPEMLYKLGIK